jgi:hypothetical protein
MSFNILSFFSFLVLGWPAYIRNLFQLPFFGQRIIILDILLYVFLLILVRSQFSRLVNFEYDSRRIYFPVIFINLSLLTILICVMNFISNQNYFFALQVVEFLMALFFILNFINLHNIESFFAFSTKWLFLYSLVILVLILFQLVFGYEFTDLITLNSLAFKAFLYYLLLKHYNFKKRADTLLILTLIFGLACQTKAIFIVILFFFMIRYIVNKFHKYHKIINFSWILAAFLLTLPFLLIYLVHLITGLSLADVEARDLYTSSDDLSSFFSRIYSVEKAIANLSNFPFFGLEFSEVKNLHVLNSPPHNLLLEGIFQGGIFGFMAVCVFIFSLLKLYKYNIYIASLSLITIIYFNDFFAWYALFLLPIFIKPTKKHG